MFYVKYSYVLLCIHGWLQRKINEELNSMGENEWAIEEMYAE